MSATNRGTVRRSFDNYQTPETLAEAFLACLDWSLITSVMEPCRGAGHIYDAVPADVKKYWCEINPDYVCYYGGVTLDYLQTDTDWTVDATITNPPYNKAADFIEVALQTSQFVAMLTRLNFLGSQKRLAQWKRWPPLTHQLVIVPRPSFTGGGSDATEYAWLCWDHLGALGDRPAFSHLEWEKVSTPASAVVVPPGLTL